MKLRYTPEAISDLQSIKQYIKSTLRNPTAATRITKMILDNCASLKSFPESGSSISALTGYETDIRMLICENYIVDYKNNAVYHFQYTFYFTAEVSVARSIDDDMVSVARIIHAKQDYMRILFRGLF